MLARNAHAQWVHSKLKRGWVYKPKWDVQEVNDDNEDSELNNEDETLATEEHKAPSSPLLVPYEQV